jgi:hypothetical protein
MLGIPAPERPKYMNPELRRLQAADSPDEKVRATTRYDRSAGLSFEGTVEIVEDIFRVRGDIVPVRSRFKNLTAL